jgi:hypothetical protein
MTERGRIECCPGRDSPVLRGIKVGALWIAKD